MPPAKRRALATDIYALTRFARGEMGEPIAPRPLIPTGGMVDTRLPRLSETEVEPFPVSPGYAPRPARPEVAAYTPEESQYLEALRTGPEEHEPSGFWSRVKDALLGAAYAARSAGPEDRGLAMIGGLAAGAINPNITHAMRFEADTLPRLARTATVSRGMADQEATRRDRFAKAFGYDPTTGESTLEGEEREWRRGELERQRQRQQLGDIGDIVNTYRQYGLPPPSGVIAGTPFSGIKGAPVTRTTTTAPPRQTAEVDGRKVLMERNPASGAWEPARDAGGNLVYTDEDTTRQLTPSQAKEEIEMELRAELGDTVAERTRRIDDLRASVYQRLRISDELLRLAEEGDVQAVNRVEQAETEIQKIVDRAMTQEFDREVAKRYQQRGGARPTPKRTGKATSKRPVYTKAQLQQLIQANRAKGVELSEEQAKAAVRAKGYNVEP